MLCIYYGIVEDEVWEIRPYFKFNYSPSWIDNDLSKDMIKDIDNSEVLTAKIIDSPIFGSISPLDLSGGVMRLISINNDPTIVMSVTGCGENCSKWLLEIGNKKDVIVSLRYLMRFEFKPGDSALIINTNKIVNNYDEMMKEYFKVSKNIKDGKVLTMKELKRIIDINSLKVGIEYDQD